MVKGPTEFENWKKKRRTTFLSFCLLTCCLGSEYSVIIPSLWFYVTDITKSAHSKVYYGFTLSIYYISAIIGSFVITKHVDKTRNIRKTILTLISCEIIGNVLYSIPLSPLFLLCGRFIQGLGDVNMSIMTAEIARSYSEKEVTSKIAVMVACFSTTFVMAPGLNIVFKLIDVNIKGFRVYYGNLPGLFMIVMFVFAWLIEYAFAYDLSKEFDLKQNKTSLDRLSDSDSETNILLRNERDYYDEQLKEQNFQQIDTHPISLLSYFDFNFLVSLGFFMSFSMVGLMDVSMPILAAEDFHFTSQTTGMLFLLTGAVFIIVLAIVKYLSKHIAEYYLLHVGLGVFVASIVLLLLVNMARRWNFNVGIVVFCSYVVILGTCSCVEQVILRSLLCKLIPSSCQTLAEGLRRSASSFACITSSLLFPFLLNYIKVVCYVTLVLVVAACILLRYRKNSLLNPKLFSVN